jgi:hypothetical protein
MAHIQIVYDLYMVDIQVTYTMELTMKFEPRCLK